MTMNGQIASADKFAFEEEIIGSVNYGCDRYQPPRQLCRVWQYGLWSFQVEGTKLERFLPKNQQEIIEF